MSMFDIAVISTVKKYLNKNYPHIEHAENAFAIITKATRSGDYSVYNLKVLNSSMTSDSGYAEFIGVKSYVYLEIGDTAAVALVYQGQKVHIIGKAV